MNKYIYTYSTIIALAFININTFAAGRTSSTEESSVPTQNLTARELQAQQNRNQNQNQNSDLDRLRNSGQFKQTSDTNARN